MTPRSRRKDHGRLSARYRHRARSRPVGALGFIIVAVLGGAAIWLWMGRRPAPRETPAGTLADSVRAAMSRGDWSRGVDFTERLARTDSRNSTVIRNLAVANHNRAVAQTLRFGRPHPALRTSLDRIETELRVLALLDSAAALARDNDEWVRARQWYGEAHERLGMPLDAFQVYTEIRGREPDFTPTLSRMTWVSRLLRNPVAPDSGPVRYRPSARTPETGSRHSEDPIPRAGARTIRTISHRPR